MIDEEYRDPYLDAARIALASWEAQRRQMLSAATTMVLPGSYEEYVPQDNFPVLVSQAVIIPYRDTDDGQLIRAATLPLLAIIKKIIEDPSLMFEIDWRKWEEIIAATYEESGQFDEVTLTPRSGDGGKDVIAVKKGFGAVRFIESVKRYKPKQEVTADEVRSLLGALDTYQASKGIISTTWEFAPGIRKNQGIMAHVPYRLEMVNGEALLKRFKEYTTPKNE
jgi:restriction system protein